MLLKRLTTLQQFQIFSPRWHDRVVLLADYKIGTHNCVTFPKANTLEGEWYISGVNAKTYPLEPMKTKSGTNMMMREVPISALQPLERE